MSQSAYSISNSDGATFRAALNTLFAAIQSCNSGSSAPSSPVAYMLWADTTNGVMKQRDASNLAWVTLFPLAAQPVPAGTVLSFAGATAPSGFLLCYGQAVSRTTYAALFSAIGTVHGAGDGSTTFNLPDLRGRVAAGKDDMGGSAANRLSSGGSGVSGNSLGAAGGAETHTLTSGQIPAHNHNLDASGNSYYLMRTSGGSVGLTSGTGLAVSTSAVQNNSGGGNAHNNTQPTLVLNSIIKT